MQYSVKNNTSQWASVHLYYKSWDTPNKISAAYLWLIEESIIGWFHTVQNAVLEKMTQGCPQTSLSHDR